MDSSKRVGKQGRARAAASLAVVLSAFVLTSCLVLAPKVVPGTYRLRTHPATNVGGATTLRLVAVTHDSRCPKDVVCIWEGELTARVMWSSGGVDTPLDLTWSVHSAPTPVPGTSYAVALDDVVGSSDDAVATVRVI